MNRVQRFKYKWDGNDTVKIPDSYLQLVGEFAKERMARYQQPVGKSRQFTVEEIQAFSPFDTNDVSVEELRASVNLEGEDPQELLQFINTVAEVELPEEQTTLVGNIDDDGAAGIAAEPKVEQPDDSAELQDTNVADDDTIHGPNKISAGRTASPQEPEQDPQMMEIEDQVLDVLDDSTGAVGDAAMANSVDDAGANVAPDNDDDPGAGDSVAPTSKTPLPRLRGKGQGQGTPAHVPVTGSFLKKEDDDSDLKFSGEGKGRLIRELKPNSEYKNMKVEIEEVLGWYPYPDHLFKSIGNGNIQLLEENMGRDATQYTLRHITGHRYYYEYQDYHGIPWEWDCPWPKYVRKVISGLLRGHVRDISIYDPACYLPVYKLLQLAAARFPQYADDFNVYNLISMAIYDDKDRFEFQCVSDSNVHEALQLYEAPVKVRCGQGHTDDVLETRSNEVLANLLPS